MFTILEWFGQNLWQMEKIGPHAGNWSRISGRLASPPFSTSYIQETPSGYTSQKDLPRIVSADSEGIARIIPSKVNGKRTAAKLR